MKKLKIIFAVAAVLSLITCNQKNIVQEEPDPLQAEVQKFVPASITEKLPVNPAMTFVKNMGTAINIGNTLDAIGTNDWHSGENGWGNPNITREFIQALKKYGYKSIRLPVTWAEYMGPAPDYKIGGCVFNCGSCPDRMDRVEEVVKWIIEEDMYCILNLHHDGGHSDKSWILSAADTPEKTADQFAKVWKQIAARFSNVAQDKLLFEAMNEVGFDTIWSRWGGGSGAKSKAYELLNTLNQTFVDTVRAAAGNEDRFLLFSGYWTDINLSCDLLFEIPKDKADNRLILSVHYYDPSTFTIADDPDNSWGFRETWGSLSDYNDLKTQYNKLKITFLDKGIPVIMGEYGATFKNKDEDSRIKWMAAVTQTSLNYGICPVLWDTGGEIDRWEPYPMEETLRRVWKIIKL